MPQPTFRDLCDLFREQHPEVSASKAKREVARLLAARVDAPKVAQAEVGWGRRRGDVIRPRQKLNHPWRLST